MTSPATPADDYLTRLLEESAKRLGEAIATATKTVMTADGFNWKPPAIQKTIAARFRALNESADLTNNLTGLICATYAEHDFPHDQVAVQEAVTRQLDNGHGGLPPMARP